MSVDTSNLKTFEDAKDALAEINFQVNDACADTNGHKIAVWI